MNFEHNLSQAEISKDKTLKRILKHVEKVKRLERGVTRKIKMEEFVRFILGAMHKRRSDNLLQTTAIWALLSLISMDQEDCIEVMLRAGVSTVLYNIMKFEKLSPPTKKYASDLISLLCSQDNSLSGLDEVSVDETSNVLRGKFDQSSVNSRGLELDNSIADVNMDEMSSIGQASGLQSFAPYYIDRKNVELMNNLFDENTLWKDINSGQANMQAVGSALDQESIDESSALGGSHTNSSTTEFWDAMYQRYNQPALPRSAGKHGNGNSSIPRMRLESAVRAGSAGAAGEDYEGQSSLYSPAVRRHVASSRKSKNASELFPSLNRQPKSPKPFAFHDKLLQQKPSTPPDLPHMDAIIPEYLTKLDPLSISVSTTLKAVIQDRQREILGETKSTATVLIDARNALPSKTQEDWDDESHDTSFEGEEKEGGSGEKNVFFARSTVNRTRITAESLHDLRFIRRLFNDRQMTIADTQDLLGKMEDILELMDKDSTGYVTWKCFARVLVSISPKHLLRADVEAFLNAQVDNENDLIDYKEFTISGKVMVIETKEGVAQILARSWYSRQKRNKMLAQGDDDPSSTYSWKNHVKWFEKRKADALVWLMRRANRAIQYYAYVSTAQSYLNQIGIFGKALSHLIECGTRALDAIDSSLLIRVNLSQRAIHAREYKQKRDEAYKYLYKKAHPEVLTAVEIQRKEILRIQKIKEEGYYKAFSPKIAKVYRLIYMTREATEYLKKVAESAQVKCDRIDAAFKLLSALGKRTVRQETIHRDTQISLYDMGEKARVYCEVLDTAVLGLMRWGENALAFFDKQEAALAWLLGRGVRAKAKSIQTDEVSVALAAFAQRHLRRANKREAAFAILRQRVTEGHDLRYRKEEAIKFLRRIPAKIWANQGVLERANEYLVAKAVFALQQQEKLTKAFKYLKVIASRSFAVTRKRNMAQTDLKQIGLLAQRKFFEKLWVPMPGNKDRLKDEVKRISIMDKRITAVRKALPEEERWKAELMDAFASLSSAFSGESSLGGVGRVNVMARPGTEENATSSSTRPTSSGSGSHQVTSEDVGGEKVSLKNKGASESDGPIIELGRLGFKQLILDGSLIGMPKGTADACYESVDADASGAVSFDEVWEWFLYQARRRAKKKPGSVVVSHQKIIPAKDRAIVALMKRFAKTSSTPGGRRSKASTSEEFSLYG